MANYQWDGPGKMREVGLIRAEAPEITEPSAPGGAEAGRRLHRCTVKGCNRKFTKAMIAARHFNASHGDLREVGEVGKDAWREWIETVSE